MLLIWMIPWRWVACLGLYFIFVVFHLKFTHCFSHMMEVFHLSGDLLIAVQVELMTVDFVYCCSTFLQLSHGKLYFVRKTKSFTTLRQTDVFSLISFHFQWCNCPEVCFITCCELFQTICRITGALLDHYWSRWWWQSHRLLASSVTQHRLNFERFSYDDIVFSTFHIWFCCDNVQLSTVFCGRVCTSTLSSWRRHSTWAPDFLYLRCWNFIIKRNLQESPVGRKTENCQW